MTLEVSNIFDVIDILSHLRQLLQHFSFKFYHVFNSVQLFNDIVFTICGEALHQIIYLWYQFINGCYVRASCDLNLIKLLIYTMQLGPYPSVYTSNCT